MKRKGNFYDKIISKDNLDVALTNSCRGKSWQRKVKRVKANHEELIDRLHDMLKNRTYKVSDYRCKTIFEPKKRLIHILPLYPDRIVQHAIMNVIEPYWDSLMIKDSYACRVGKGQHKGSKECMRLCRNYKYVLKCDISKFYPSLDHDILKSILREKLKDEPLIELLNDIIDSISGDKGVPIGSYLSQWFGNLYMNKLDMWIKHTKRIKAYIRYCDDFVVFGNDKKALQDLKKEIVEFCEDKLKLRLSKSELFPCNNGIDFLGYRHFPNGKILLRKSTAKRMTKRFNLIRKKLERGCINVENAIAQIASAKGWLSHANTYNFRCSRNIEGLNDGLLRYTQI